MPSVAKSVSASPAERRTQLLRLSEPHKVELRLQGFLSTKKTTAKRRIESLILVALIISSTASEIYLSVACLAQFFSAVNVLPLAIKGLHHARPTRLTFSRESG